MHRNCSRTNPPPQISRQNTSIITSEPAPISVSSGRPKLELEAPASSILETFKSLLPPGIWPTAKAEDFHIDSEEDEEEEGADSESETEERGRGQDQEGEGQKRGRSTSGSTRERKKQRVYWSKS